MIPYERLDEIMRRLRLNHVISIHDLAEAIHTSEATIRRDLTVLVKRGQVRKVFGGVALVNQNTADLPFPLRQRENKIIKEKVAARAVKHLFDGARVILDGCSTSVQQMLPYIDSKMRLSVICNSLEMCRYLMGKCAHIYCTGGLLDAKNIALLGRYAENTVENIYADIIFFSSDGLNDEGFISDNMEANVTFLRKAMSHAEKRVYLCDSPKYSYSGAHALCSLSDVDVVISDIPPKKGLEDMIGRPPGTGHFEIA